MRAMTWGMGLVSGLLLAAGVRHGLAAIQRRRQAHAKAAWWAELQARMAEAAQEVADRRAAGWELKGHLWVAKGGKGR